MAPAWPGQVGQQRDRQADGDRGRGHRQHLQHACRIDGHARGPESGRYNNRIIHFWRRIRIIRRVDNRIDKFVFQRNRQFDRIFHFGRVFHVGRVFRFGQHQQHKFRWQ